MLWVVVVTVSNFSKEQVQMKIYENVQRFDSKTGKPYFVKRFKEFRCDFSGQLIDEDDLETYFYPSYNLDYESSDPCFGSCGDEYEFGQKHDVAMFEFLSDTYHFRNDIDPDGHGFIDQSVKMMQHYLPDRLSFAEMCRTSRIVTAEKLIESGEIAADQLSL
jgi:hypothetical protein